MAGFMEWLRGCLFFNDHKSSGIKISKQLEDKNQSNATAVTLKSMRESLLLMCYCTVYYVSNILKCGSIELRGYVSAKNQKSYLWQYSDIARSSQKMGSVSKEKDYFWRWEHTPECLEIPKVKKKKYIV